MDESTSTVAERVRNNPAIVVAAVLGAFTALSSYFIDLGSGIDMNTALGKAFGIFGLSGGAGVIIRGLVDGPATVERKKQELNEVIDAEAVIRQAEGG